MWLELTAYQIMTLLSSSLPTEVLVKRRKRDMRLSLKGFDCFKIKLRHLREDLPNFEINCIIVIYCYTLKVNSVSNKVLKALTDFIRRI